MPTAASIMISSQLPLAPDPLITTGRYTVRSIFAKRGSRPHLPGEVWLTRSASPGPLPQHRLGGAGVGVGALVGTADLGVGRRSALDGGARLGLAGQRGQRVA